MHSSHCKWVGSETGRKIEKGKEGRSNCDNHADRADVYKNIKIHPRVCAYV